MSNNNIVPPRREGQPRSRVSDVLNRIKPETGIDPVTGVAYHTRIPIAVSDSTIYQNLRSYQDAYDRATSSIRALPDDIGNVGPVNRSRVFDVVGGGAQAQSRSLVAEVMFQKNLLRERWGINGDDVRGLLQQITNGDYRPLSIPLRQAPTVGETIVNTTNKFIDISAVTPRDVQGLLPPSAPSARDWFDRPVGGGCFIIRAAGGLCPLDFPTTNEQRIIAYVRTKETLNKYVSRVKFDYDSGIAALERAFKNPEQLLNLPADSKLALAMGQVRTRIRQASVKLRNASAISAVLDGGEAKFTKKPPSSGYSEKSLSRIEGVYSSRIKFDNIAQTALYDDINSKLLSNPEAEAEKWALVSKERQTALSSVESDLTTKANIESGGGLQTTSSTRQLKPDQLFEKPTTASFMDAGKTPFLQNLEKKPLTSMETFSLPQQKPLPERTMIQMTESPIGRRELPGSKSFRQQGPVQPGIIRIENENPSNFGRGNIYEVADEDAWFGVKLKPKGQDGNPIPYTPDSKLVSVDLDTRLPFPTVAETIPTLPNADDFNFGAPKGVPPADLVGEVADIGRFLDQPFHKEPSGRIVHAVTDIVDPTPQQLAAASDAFVQKNSSVAERIKQFEGLKRGKSDPGFGTGRRWQRPSVGKLVKTPDPLAGVGLISEDLGTLPPPPPPEPLPPKGPPTPDPKPQLTIRDADTPIPKPNVAISKFAIGAEVFGAALTIVFAAMTISEVLKQKSNPMSCSSLF